MRHRAHLHHGAFRMLGGQGGESASSPLSRRGFTLLEMCTVLFIIMLLLAAMMPAIQSAFIEQAVRGDAHQLSLMVRTAMMQSSEQHRPYVLDLTATSMSLHPVGETPAPASDDASATNQDEDASKKNTTPENIEITNQLDQPNKFLVPDPQKAGTWIAMPPTSCLFRPGELCPVPHVHLARGKAWVEMNFNALTGSVENETAYFP